MSALANAVAKLSAATPPKPVTRRDELLFDGPRPLPQGEVTVNLSLDMQRKTGDPTRLLRTASGDETTGKARVWVTAAALAGVGWTELQVAPPEDADGPPGDLIDWEGRRWEVTEFQGWDARFGGNQDPGFLRYVAVERGATP